MLRVCVIGMGPIGNNHARIYKMLDFVEVVAVCDRRLDRAEAAGKTYDVPYYLDAQKMLDEMKPDIVSVATGGYEYSSDHCQPVLQALRSGAHVLCEKPISNDIGCAKLMVETAKKYDRCFGIDFNHRFTPAALQAKKWQDDGRLGDLLFVNMALWIGKFMPLESEFYHLKALNPHSVDMMRYFCGDIDEVQCYAMKAPGRWIYSSSSINMRFKNGMVGHLTSSYDIERGHPMERCEVGGTMGRFVVEDMWLKSTLFPRGNMVREEYVNPVFGGYESFFDTFKARVTCFAEQIRDGVRPEDINGSGAAGLEASRVIHAAIESIKRGNVPVKVESITF